MPTKCSLPTAGISLQTASGIRRLDVRPPVGGWCARAYGEALRHREPVPISQKEFPILTLRRTYFKSAVDELLWIWQKKSNDVHELHSHVWDAWADENGSIGKCVRLPAGRKAPIQGGHVSIRWTGSSTDLLHNPQSRRIMTNLYVHQDLNEMKLYPCAYGMTFNVTGNTLNAILNQRSQDMLTANNWNVAQYAALVLMFAAASGACCRGADACNRRTAAHL